MSVFHPLTSPSFPPLLPPFFPLSLPPDLHRVRDRLQPGQRPSRARPVRRRRGRHGALPLVAHGPLRDGRDDVRGQRASRHGDGAGLGGHAAGVRSFLSSFLPPFLPPSLSPSFFDACVGCVWWARWLLTRERCSSSMALSPSVPISFPFFLFFCFASLPTVICKEEEEKRK